MFASCYMMDVVKRLEPYSDVGTKDEQTSVKSRLIPFNDNVILYITSIVGTKII